MEQYVKYDILRTRVHFRELFRTVEIRLHIIHVKSQQHNIPVIASGQVMSTNQERHCWIVFISDNVIYLLRCIYTNIFAHFL